MTALWIGVLIIALLALYGYIQHVHMAVQRHKTDMHNLRMEIASTNELARRNNRELRALQKEQSDE